MKTDFAQILTTRKGEPIREQGIEAAILSAAVRLKKDGDKINNLFAAGLILDREHVKISEVLQLQGEPLTLRDVCCNALDSTIQVKDERGNLVNEQLDFKEKRRLNHLATKIWGTQEPIDIKTEDITTLKDRIARFYIGNLVPGQVCDMLDPEEPEK